MSSVITKQGDRPAPSRSETLSMRIGKGHAVWVRLCHWVGVIAVLCLLVSGYAMLMTNPNLYWGEVGNPLVRPWLEVPVSRNYQHGGWSEPTPFFDTPDSAVSAIRGYEILNENGWGRSLHFFLLVLFFIHV